MAWGFGSCCLNSDRGVVRARSCSTSCKLLRASNVVCRLCLGRCLCPGGIFFSFSVFSSISVSCAASSSYCFAKLLTVEFAPVVSAALTYSTVCLSCTSSRVVSSEIAFFVFCCAFWFVLVDANWCSGNAILGLITWWQSLSILGLIRA